MARTNPPFMSGVPELLILRLLHQRQMYGYELVKMIRLATGETISLGEGVIYPILHSLEESGSLRAKRKEVNGRTRVYYTLSAKGRRRLDHLLSEWGRINTGVSAALGDKAYA